MLTFQTTGVELYTVGGGELFGGDVTGAEVAHVGGYLQTLGSEELSIYLQTRTYIVHTYIVHTYLHSTNTYLQITHLLTQYTYTYTHTYLQNTHVLTQYTHTYTHILT